MEMLDDKELDDAKNINVNNHRFELALARKEWQDRYSLKLPSCMKENTSLDNQLEQARADLVHQMKETTRAQKLCDTVELNAKYFRLGQYNDDHVIPKIRPRALQKHPQQDLLHANDINVLGLRDEAKHLKNYNYDKYARRDPMQVSLDARMNEKPYLKVPPITRPKNPDWRARETYMKQTEPDSYLLHVGLPQNIKHQFGTKVCREVLSNKELVEQAVSEQESVRKKAQHRKPLVQHPTRELDVSCDPTYQELGDLLRANIRAGYSRDHKVSVKQTDYTKDPFDRRHKIPDEYRFHKDAVTGIKAVLHGQMD